jgi:hypothetical protein
MFNLLPKRHRQDIYRVTYFLVMVTIVFSIYWSLEAGRLDLSIIKYTGGFFLFVVVLSWIFRNNK